MRAVWSFWTKPWRNRRGWNWPSEKYHLLAWVLSVEAARQHYPRTSLITDTHGARMLVDGLGLTFDHVSTELDDLDAHEPDLWMLGKLRAYRAQTEPFVHLDTDVFLWKRLPEHLEQAPVLAQNPEYFSVGASHYRPERIVQMITAAQAGWVPPEWEWFLSLGSPQRGECCGIAGGNHVEFIRYYADTALRLVQEPANAAVWRALSNRIECNTSIEQYHLAACVEYHRFRPDSPYRGVEIRYLFDSFALAFDPNHAATLGFTHILASAKQSQVVADRIEQRVAREYPNYYDRCLRLAARLRSL